MFARPPNRPIEMVQPDEAERSTFTCYTAPGAVFASEEEMKEHYRSEWHRYNLKRKVAGLAPLPREAFEERAAREGEREAALQQKSGTRKQAREERRVRRAEANAKNSRSKAADFAATHQMTADEYMAFKMENAAPFDEGSDLFSSHHSEGLHENLAYMAKTHGFYVPHLDYCVDLPGLIQYLQEKVYVGNVSLLHSKAFHSVESVQVPLPSAPPSPRPRPQMSTPAERGRPVPQRHDRPSPLSPRHRATCATSGCAASSSRATRRSSASFTTWRRSPRAARSGRWRSSRRRRRRRARRRARRRRGARARPRAPTG